MAHVVADKIPLFVPFKEGAVPIVSDDVVFVSMSWGDVLFVDNRTVAIVWSIDMIGHCVEASPRKIIDAVAFMKVGLVIQFARPVRTIRIMDY